MDDVTFGRSRPYGAACDIGAESDVYERLVNGWNTLPTSVDFSSVATFKSSIRNVDFLSFMRYSL